MKNKIISLLLFSGFLYSSCSDFLTEKQQYRIDASQVFSTEDKAKLALTGALSQMENGFAAVNTYHQLIGPAGGFLAYPTNSGHIAEYNNFIFKENQSYPQSVWNANYNINYSLNAIINYFEENYQNFDELSNGYKTVLGTAYFLRAYQYFKLVRLWGDIPLVLKPALGITHTPLTKEADVYTQVIKDFEQAKKLLPDGKGTPQSYAGPIKSAADAFLAKVYATEAGWLNMPELWQKAKEYADLVINSGNYKLVDDLKTLYSVAGRNSQEAILEFQNNTESNLNNLAQVYTPQGLEINSWSGYIKVQPWMWYQQISDPLYSDFTKSATTGKVTQIRDHDPRVDICYIDSSFYNKFTGKSTSLYPLIKYASGCYLYLAKYLDPNRTSTASLRNWIVFRYADILLLRAEIENELNGPTNAYQYVNQVLTRARNNGKTKKYPLNWDATNVPTKDQFRVKIAWERMYELIGEGHDFFEARRRGKEFLVNNFISVHNNFTDVTFYAGIKTKATDDGIMHLKIPIAESAANDSIQ